MRHLKMLGLAMVAAAALMAFLGGGSASATVLCKTNIESGCAASGWAYSSGTEINASLEGSFIVSNTSGSVENTCTEVSNNGSTTNAGSATITVIWTITSWSISNCAQTTVVTLAHTTIELHWIPGRNARLTVRGFRFHMILFGVKCAYGFGEGGVELGTLTGGNPATMDVNAVIPKVEGSFLCPGDLRLESNFKITSPVPLYVSES
jgi:hypothetical protein